QALGDRAQLGRAGERRVAVADVRLQDLLVARDRGDELRAPRLEIGRKRSGPDRRRSVRLGGGFARRRDRRRLRRRGRRRVTRGRRGGAGGRVGVLGVRSSGRGLGGQRRSRVGERGRCGGRRGLDGRRIDGGWRRDGGGSGRRRVERHLL